ncbi:MAG: hypothetical protein D6715_05170 [Calditrichaeota bacterium]|nr:MAG: hypothetical protein D6715_05170 [Calditrichota bacterium]
MKKIALFVLSALMLWVAVVAFAAPGKSKTGHSKVVHITMTNTLKFNPASDTIRVGQTVEWRNTSLLVHTVTCDPKKAAKPEHVALPEGAEPFDSGNMDPDATFRHTFTVPGVYKYFCIPHEAAGMVGEIVVLPAK